MGGTTHSALSRSEQPESCDRCRAFSFHRSRFQLPDCAVDPPPLSGSPSASTVPSWMEPWGMCMHVHICQVGDPRNCVERK
jgi:hypothetical protein